MEVSSSEGNTTKCIAVAPVYKLFILKIDSVLYHSYPLVFMDRSLFQCKVYCIIDEYFCIRNCFIHLCAVFKCTTVQHHSAEMNHLLALLLKLFIVEKQRSDD